MCRADKRCNKKNTFHLQYIRYNHGIGNRYDFYMYGIIHSLVYMFHANLVVALILHCLFNSINWLIDSEFAQVFNFYFLMPGRY